MYISKILTFFKKWWMGILWLSSDMWFYLFWVSKYWPCYVLRVWENILIKQRLLHSCRILPSSAVVKESFRALHSSTGPCRLLLGSILLAPLSAEGPPLGLAGELLCPTECALMFPLCREPPNWLLQVLLMTKPHGHPWPTGIRYFSFIDCTVLKILQSMVVLLDIR